MNLNPIASNQTEVERDGGVTVFYSYKTPVAVFVPGQGAIVTDRFYSRTTSKHIGQALKRWGATKHIVTQETIDGYAK